MKNALESQELPREKFMEKGADALSDAELIAILLRAGIQGKPVLELAKELLERHDNNLLELSRSTFENFRSIHGMGETKSVMLCAVFALAKRIVSLRMDALPHMNHPEFIAEYIRENLISPSQEEFHTLLLDCRLRLIKDVRVTVGLLDRSLIHAREVFREAITRSAFAIILVHNHPSGDVTPSAEDMKITRELAKAGDILGIKVTDHVIVASSVETGTKGYYSFQQAGKMPP